jgi:hypothetical protein
LWKIWKVLRREAVGEMEVIRYRLYISSIRYCASSLSSHALLKAAFESRESCKEIAPTPFYPMLSLWWLPECVASLSRWRSGTGRVVIRSLDLHVQQWNPLVMFCCRTRNWVPRRVLYGIKGVVFPHKKRIKE